MFQNPPQLLKVKEKERKKKKERKGYWNGPSKTRNPGGPSASFGSPAAPKLQAKGRGRGGSCKEQQ